MPRNKSGARRDEYLSVRVTDDMAQALARLAGSSIAGETVSDIIRVALEREIRRRRRRSKS